VKRKQKAFFLFFFVFALAFPEYPAMIGEAAADSGQLLTYTLRDAKGTLTVDADGVLVRYEGPGGDIVIPAHLGITAIGEKAFYGNNRLTGISLPEGVNRIGAWAFAYCSGLTGITIPDSVTDIVTAAAG